MPRMVDTFARRCRNPVTATLRNAQSIASCHLSPSSANATRAVALVLKHKLEPSLAPPNTVAITAPKHFALVLATLAIVPSTALLPSGGNGKSALEPVAKELRLGTERLPLMLAMAELPAHH
jgi:hypothetical protein